MHNIVGVHNNIITKRIHEYLDKYEMDTHTHL